MRCSFICYSKMSWGSPHLPAHEDGNRICWPSGRMKRLSRQLLLVGIIGVACPLLYHTLMSQWSSYTLRAGPNSGHLSENVDTDFTVEDCPPRWEEKPEIPRELGSEIKGDKDAPTQWSKQQGAGGMLLQADTVRARGGNHKVQANADTLLGTAKLTTEETPRDQAGVMAQGKDINRSVHSPVHKGVPGDNATPVAPKLQGNSKLATVGTLGDRDGVAQERDASTRVRSPAPKGVVDNTTIHLAVVVCGERVEESLTMLKSATLFTRTFMSFHIFTEDGLRGNFTTQVMTHQGWTDQRPTWSKKVSIYMTRESSVLSYKLKKHSTKS